MTMLVARDFCIACGSPDLHESLITTIVVITNPYGNVNMPVTVCKFCATKPFDEVIIAIAKTIRELYDSEIDEDTTKRLLIKSIEQINLHDIKHKTIMLIGSTRFFETFIKLEEKFSLEGYCVLMPAWCGFRYKNRYKLTPGTWDHFLELMYQKIEKADIIFVVNDIDKDTKHPYIGKHTEMEIKYALMLKKEIQTLNPLEKE